MSVRAVRGFQAFVFLLFSLVGLSLSGPALAAGEARSIVTTDEQRLFRLRPAVRAECLARPVQDHLPRRPPLPRLHLQHQGQMVLPQIRLRPAEALQRRGRRQGRQPDRGDPDIGAPPELTFFPTWMADEAAPYRTEPDRRHGQAASEGPGRARRRRRAGDADRRSAHRHAETTRPRSSISPDDGALWLKLARAMLARPAGQQPARPRLCQRNATSAAFNAYQLLRTTDDARRSAGRASPSGSTAATSSARRCRPMRRASRW